MAYIHIPRRHLIQPQGRLKVHPQWDSRLVSLIHFGTGKAIDLVDIGTDYALLGPGVIRANLMGMGLGFDTAGTSCIQSSNALSSFSGSPTFCYWLPRVGTQLGNGGMLHIINSGDNRHLQLAPSGDGIYILGAGSPTPLGESINNTSNRSLIVRATSNDPAIFIDCRKVAGATGTYPAGSKTLRLGAWTSAGWQFIGDIGSAAIVQGELSDAEAVEHANSPWMFYASDPIRFYSLPSGPITLNSLTMSAFTSSGARATLSITR